MPQISYAGAFNSATISLADVYINVLPPNGGVVTPAQTGLVGIRGVASWGPVDVATPVGNIQQAAIFGVQKVRKYCLATAAAVVLQAQLAIGAGAGLMCSRATDGTDTAASSYFGLTASGATIGSAGTSFAANDTVTLTNGVQIKILTVSGGVPATISVLSAAATSEPTNPVAQATTSGTGTGFTATLTYTYGLLLTSLYTGSGANGDIATIAVGSAANSWKVTLQHTGYAAEVFDNITGTANALWVAIAAAINNGNSVQRGPSQTMIATAGTATAAPTASSATLAGGTDGTATITASVLMGTESGSTRTGIYAFRSLGCSDGFVADLDDHTMNAGLITFAQSEGIRWHAANAAGDTPSAAATQKATDGTDNPWLKLYIGAWIYWNDTVNGQQRLLSPATFGAALCSTLTPQNSGLNKQVPGVVSTQRAKSGNPYSNLELGVITNAGMDVICNPIPAGSMFGLRTGRTASSNPSNNTDNWPALTSFIARSLAGPGALGPAIGQLITDDFFTTWYDVLDNFLAGLASATPDPLIEAYQINFSETNNPPTQTALGLIVAEILIQYLGIAQVFLVNLQTGATVVIPQASSSFALGA